MSIRPEEFKALLAEELDPQTFVRRGLGLLESQFRTIALLALADWQECGIYCADLFPAITSLQRPSWGHWNGLISALRNARKQVLRSHGPEERQTLERAHRLKRTLDLFEEPLPPELVTQLQPLAQLLNQKLRGRHRLSQILTLPIAMRNRIAHDVPNDAEWWQSAEQGLRHLLAFHGRRSLCDQIRGDGPYPSPWFLTNIAGDEVASDAEAAATPPQPAESDVAPEPAETDDETDDAEGAPLPDVWAFNGLDQQFAVLYVHPRKRTRHRKDATRPTLLAFQQLLGRADAYEGDFKKLLSKMAPEDLKGVIMGDFLVGRPVGSGGFATVHIGRQLSTGRVVAIKILHDGMDEEIAERFRQEARYLSQFRHPHIVGVISYGEETWRAPRQRDLVRSLKEESWYQRFSKSAPVKTYIALEWVEGHTLEAIYQGLHRGKSPHDPRATTAEATPWKAPDQAQLATWYAQAANALNAVHALGLIHRDVKPANLMVNDKGQLKLMDFGIARSQDENRTLVTTFGQGIGTPAYMSPEQIKAGHGDATLGPNTDIYSLSATFYELFTGRRLYHHDLETIDSVQTKKLGGELPLPPRAAVEGLPWEIETILMGGLQAEISDRYPSMEALEQDLRRFLADEPITYKRPSIWRQLQLNYRRHRIVYQLVALFVLLVGGGGLAHVQQLRKEKDKTAKARWLAVERYKQAEIEKRRALRNERIAQRASSSARRLALLAMKRAKQAKEAQQATMREKQKVERQRKKLLAIQRRFLLERLRMIRLSTLKQSAAETVLRFFQEVLDEAANPRSHHELALRGIQSLLHQEQMGHRAETILSADLANALFAGLLRYTLRPSGPRQIRLSNRREAAWCAAMLAPYIDQEDPRHLPLLKQLQRRPQNARAWQLAQRRQLRWLTPVARLLGAGLQDPDVPIQMAMAGSLLRLGYGEAFQLRRYYFPLSRWRAQVSHEMFMMLISAPQIEALAPLPRAMLEELGDSPSVDVRRKALRLLAQQGPKSTPTLLGGLSDSSWSIRREARALITRMGAPAVPHIYNALDDQDKDARYYSFSILRRIGKPALPALLRAFTHTTRMSTYRAYYSIKAIVRRTRAPLAFAALKSLLHHKRSEVRRYSLQLLTLLSKTTLQAHIKHLWKLAHDPDESVKSTALQMLKRLDLRQHQPQLRRYLASQRWDKGGYKLKAARYRLLAKDARRCEHLSLMMRGLKDSSSAVRNAAREALATCGKAALPLLSGLLAKPTDWVARREAVRTLGQMKQAPPQVLSMLEKALSDHDDNVRYEVLVALGGQGPKALPLMARALYDPIPHVREALARGLARQGHAATRLLQMLLLDSSYTIRRRAYQQLKRNIPPRELDLALLVKAHARMGWQLRSYLRAVFKKTQAPVLLDLIAAEELPVFVRSQALQELMRRRDSTLKQRGLIVGLQSPQSKLRIASAKLAVRQSPTTALAQALRSALNDKDSDVRKSALPCLYWSLFTPRQKTRLFRRALRDPNRYIRRKVIGMLARYKPNAVLLQLLGLVRSDSYGWNQYHAARLLGKYATAPVPLKKKALRHLQVIVQEGRTASTKRKALTTAMAFGSLALPLLRQSLADRTIRLMALQAASRLSEGIIKLRPQIKRAFRTPHPKARAAAAKLIGKLGIHAEELLPHALRHRLYQVRRGVLDGLRRTRYWNDALLPLIAERLKDKRKWARRRAVYVLQHAGPKAVPLLKQALQDQSSHVQNAAVITLTRLGLPIEELIMHLRYAFSAIQPSKRSYARSKLLKHIKKHPRYALFLAGMIPSVDLQAKLLRWLVRKSDETTFQHSLALARLLYPAMHPLDLATTSAPTALLTWWSQQPHQQISRRRIAQLLGRTCHPDAALHLRHALRRDDAAQVRGQAALSLARLGPLAQAALPELKRALRDVSPQVRAAAAHALRRLRRPATAPQDAIDHERNERCFRAAQAVLFGHTDL